MSKFAHQITGVLGEANLIMEKADIMELDSYNKSLVQELSYNLNDQYMPFGWHEITEEIVEPLSRGKHQFNFFKYGPSPFDTAEIAKDSSITIYRQAIGDHGNRELSDTLSGRFPGEDITEVQGLNLNTGYGGGYGAYGGQQIGGNFTGQRSRGSSGLQSGGFSELQNFGFNVQQNNGFGFNPQTNLISGSQNSSRLMNTNWGAAIDIGSQSIGINPPPFELPIDEPLQEVIPIEEVLPLAPNDQ
jgi:hypothetical protein